MSPKRRLLLSALLGASALCAATFTSAATPIRVGFIPSTDGVALWVAQDQGFFTKRGLDVTLIPMPTAPAATAAVMSGASDVMLTGLMSVFQAADNDLPFKIFAGALVLPTGSNLSVVANSNIKSAKDLVGKRFAVPGYGTALDIMSRKWLIDNGVDVGKVQFVEAGQVLVPDLLKSGQIDASVMSDPVYARVIREKTASKLGDLYGNAPAGVVVGGYSATKKWTDANPQAIQAFREALDEGARFAKANEGSARQSISKYLKLTPEVVADVPIPNLSAQVAPKNLEWYINVMYSQKMLQTKLDLQALVLP
jgi:NitT/TauT family transport system substrate-binding protein